MSNILKVTTPMTGYDNSNNARTVPTKVVDQAVQGQINPEKVMKPDARSDAASQDANSALKFRFESNYENFLSQIRGFGPMTEEFSKLFFSRFATMAQSGLGANFAEQVAHFFDTIGMDEQDVLAFLKNQSSASIKFSGAFFTLLHSAYNQATTADIRSGILDFLRKYSDMSESSHVMKNTEILLNQIRGTLFPNARDSFDALIAQLNFGAQTSEEQMENSLVLKEKIIPFLNRYITSMHDRGDLRELTSGLATYIARLDNGMAQRVQEAFEQLMKYPIMQKVFQNLDPSLILQMLNNTEFERAKKQQKWMDSLIDIIKSGMEGNSGIENKAMLKNLMQSIVVNESVYMPVLHMMIPLQVGGKMMFGEMWIDPDSDKKGRSQGGGRAIQGLIKFDIQDLGFFDFFFIYQNETINLQLSCPEELGEFLPYIKEDVTKILSQNQIRIGEMFVESGVKSIPISEAFPKIFERKNSVNVSI